MILPPVPHLPGHTPRPPDTLFDPLKVGLSPDLSPAALVGSDAFRAGLRAFEARYYWEAHELWEAVWICLPPAGPDRLLLRGLIQLANAGLKMRIGRVRAALRILDLADTALAEAARRAGDGAMELPSARLATLRRQAANESAEIKAL